MDEFRLFITRKQWELLRLRSHRRKFISEMYIIYKGTKGICSEEETANLRTFIKDCIDKHHNATPPYIKAILGWRDKSE